MGKISHQRSFQEKIRLKLPKVLVTQVLEAFLLHIYFSGENLNFNLGFYLLKNNKQENKIHGFEFLQFLVLMNSWPTQPTY